MEKCEKYEEYEKHESHEEYEKHKKHKSHEKHKEHEKGAKDEEYAIEIENLSKVYKLYNKPIDRLKETLSITHKSYHDDFYALNNINLFIRKGETVGIIGKNGAGKSTLLKIITGVLSPTSGAVKINGRISSLLELGAGFNSEYTGIENIYLNGTLMGMSKKEVDERMQDILDFADIGEFVYQPVKTYSSGMYVRLAFSVAINVEPDILIVDEALAVGDARFQLKCLKEIERMKEKNITILVVSHSIEMLKTFTTLAVLLDAGKIQKIGAPVEIGLLYYRILYGNKVENNLNENTLSLGESNESNDTVIYPDIKQSFGNGGAQIDKIVVKGIRNGNVFCSGSQIEFYIYYSIDQERIKELLNIHGCKDAFLFGLRMENGAGVVITDFHSDTIPDFQNISYKHGKKIALKYVINVPNIAPGDYWFSPELAFGERENYVVLLEYVYLFSLKCISLKEKLYLGLMKMDFDMCIL